MLDEDVGDINTRVVPPVQPPPPPFQSITDSCYFAASPDPTLSFSRQFSAKWLCALCSWRRQRLKSMGHLPVASDGISVL